MNRAQRYRTEAAQRYKANIVGMAMIAISSSVICVFAIGMLPTLLIIPAVIAAVVGLMKLALARDRSRRRLGRSADVIAVARSTVARRELANFSADAGPRSRVVPGLSVTWNSHERRSLGGRRNGRGKLGALDVVIPTSSISRVDTARLPGWVRCDALCIQITDGRDFLVFATDPSEIESWLDLVGVTRHDTP